MHEKKQTKNGGAGKKLFLIKKQKSKNNRPSEPSFPFLSSASESAALPQSAKA
jgi:hypothetical protein